MIYNNTERANRAQQALNTYEPDRVEQEDSGLRDLLCDLRHLADRTGQDWDLQMRMAMSNYRAELIEDGTDADREKAHDKPDELTQASQNLIDQLTSLRAMVADAAFVLEEEERAIEVQLNEIDTTVEAIHTIHLQEEL